MSQENVEIVRWMWDAFLAADFQTALSFYAPDVEWDGTNLPDGRIARATRQFSITSRDGLRSGATPIGPDHAASKGVAAHPAPNAVELLPVGRRRP